MKRIAYVVDSLSWVQAQRAKDLQPYLPEHELVPMLPRDLSTPVACDAFWLASWRILLANPELENMLPLESTLAGVTSHYNIGGGLKPETCFRKGSDPDEEFQKAIAILQRFRLVTCNSKILFDRLRRHVPRLLLTQNGVDTTLFQPAQDIPQSWETDSFRIVPTIGYVAHRKLAKNCEAFALAMRTLGGAVRDNSRVSEKTARPTRTRRGMAHYYNSLDYYVCTSWHEGTPNPALEAAACGLPLITTAVGNMPELVQEGETGWFIEPTAESLIACIERLQHLEPWEYRRMSEAIRAEIEASWSWRTRSSAFRMALEVVCR